MKPFLFFLFTVPLFLQAQIGMYVGSFDPPTFAHANLIERASKLCDKLYVAIGVNPAKPNTFLSLEKRIDLLLKITKGFSNVEIVSFTGLTIDYAKLKGVDCLIRGLRSVQDFEFEYAICTANREMSGIDTLFLLSKPEHRHISSSLVREIYKFGGKIDLFVPNEVLEDLGRQNQ